MYADLSIEGNFSGWHSGDNAGFKDEQKRHLRVQHYFEGVDIFSFQFIIIACNVKVPQNHSVFAFIRFADTFENFQVEKKCEIIILDSQRDEDRADEIFKHLRNWLLVEYVEKSKLAQPMFKFAAGNATRVPARVS